MPYRIVVVGASLGGLRAVSALLAALPAGFGLPVVVAQHRSPDDAGLAAFLQRSSARPVLEAEDKLPLAPGSVYLAPPDYHLLVDGERLALSTEAPLAFARPSIDVLFESAADAHGPHAVGVILTGASDDGAAGLARIRGRGGLAIVQEPAEAACAVMPRAAIVAAGADHILPLAAIAPALASLVTDP
jgi:two-component system chemotaxis response regulator CheB